MEAGSDNDDVVAAVGERLGSGPALGARREAAADEGGRKEEGRGGGSMAAFRVRLIGAFEEGLGGVAVADGLEGVGFWRWSSESAWLVLSLGLCDTSS